MRVAPDFQSGGGEDEVFCIPTESIGGLLSEVPNGTRMLLLLTELRFEKHTVWCWPNTRKLLNRHLNWFNV
jgi:hypothetical protein